MPINPHNPTNGAHAGAIVETAAGLAPDSIKASWFSRRPSARRSRPARPPVAMPVRPASPRSWRFPPPLT